MTNESNIKLGTSKCDFRNTYLSRQKLDKKV